MGEGSTQMSNYEYVYLKDTAHKLESLTKEHTINSIVNRIISLQIGGNINEY